MPKIRTFNKSPHTYSNLLTKLEGKGLFIKNAIDAETQLRNIGYYRLIGYGLAFEEYSGKGARLGTYAPGTQFEDLVSIHTIDRSIRSLLLVAIERIEVAVRNIINYELACKYNDAHWYMEPVLFRQSRTFTHAALINEIKRLTQKNAKFGSDIEGKREAFINHYYSHYDEPPYPPCWMLAETMPLGAWSKIYEHLAVSKDRKLISKQLDLSPATLQSWLHAITYLRNMCAHHSRLFGRKFVIRPNRAKGVPYIDENRLFNYVCIVSVILKSILAKSGWVFQLYDQLQVMDDKVLREYGFEGNWFKGDFWLEFQKQ